MTDLVQCNFKLPRFFTNQAASRVLKLEFIDPDLPASVPVWGSYMFLQFPQTGFPAGADGDISGAIDPESRYVNSSGWPNVELAYQPMINYLKTIGMVQPALRTRGQWLHLPKPFIYRSGDSLIFAPELSSPAGVPYEGWPYWGVLYERDGEIPVGDTVFSTDLPNETWSAVGYSIRNVIPNISAGGTKIRFHTLAPVSHPGIIDHAFVGVRDGSTGNTVGVPVEAKFLGTPGYHYTYGDSQDGIWSDWLDFETVAGQDLLIGFDIFSAGGMAWTYKATSSYASYSSATPSYNTAAIAAPTFNSARSYIVDKVAIF